MEVATSINAPVGQQTKGGGAPQVVWDAVEVRSAHLHAEDTRTSSLCSFVILKKIKKCIHTVSSAISLKQARAVHPAGSCEHLCTITSSEHRHALLARK